MQKYELINSFNQSGNGFTTAFPSGNVTIPDKTGAYIISSGCGSGKSSSIKDIIRQRYDKGILYAVDVVSEATKMFQYVTEVICNETPLQEDDVFLLVTPDKIDDSVIKTKAQAMYDKFKINPSVVTSKKVVIITHIRLWTDVIDKFLLYKDGGIEHLPPFDGDFERLMSRPDLRSYIIMDETPLFFKPFFTMPRSLLPAFLEKEGSVWTLRPRPLMEEIYDRYIDNSDFQFFNSNTKSGKEKREIALNLIEKYYHEWSCLKNVKTLSTSFFPKDLAQPGMKSHLLVYEGAGDVLFSGNNTGMFKLLDTKDKYDCKVVFREFDYTMDRTQDLKDQPKAVSQLLQTIKTVIENSYGEKTLIVCRKDYGDKKSKTGESPFADYLKRMIPSMGIVDDSIYSVTYFGSNMCKSTNEFREYKNIVLAADWTPSPLDLRMSYGFDTSRHDYKLYFYIQLISRIGIRNRNQGTYNVYYSSDYNDDFIEQLEVYFNNNKFTATSPRRRKSLDDELLDKMTGLGIRKKVRDDICKLTAYYPQMSDSILNGSSMSLSVSLKDLATILGRKTKEKRKFVLLVNNLSLFHIALQIT